MSEVFKASNNYEVTRTAEGGVEVRGSDVNRTKWIGGTLHTPLGKALAEYVDDQVAKAQAARDEQLGRWRSPIPDFVVYPRPYNGDEVRVLSEAWPHWEDVTRQQVTGVHVTNPLMLAAMEYFAAHPKPEPKPWEGAKVGEGWVLDMRGGSSLVHSVVQSGDHLWFTRGDVYGEVRVVEFDDPDLVNAHLIWSRWNA